MINSKLTKTRGWSHDSRSNHRLCLASQTSHGRDRWVERWRVDKGRDRGTFWLLVSCFRWRSWSALLLGCCCELCQIEIWSWPEKQTERQSIEPLDEGSHQRCADWRLNGDSIEAANTDQIKADRCCVFVSPVRVTWEEKEELKNWVACYWSDCSETLGRHLNDEPFGDGSNARQLHGSMRTKRARKIGFSCFY